MYRTKEEVQARVQEHYDWAVGAGYEVVGVFLQGSWNYEREFMTLSDEESDVDTKCLILPTFESICLGKKMISTTCIMDDEEHCDLKDLRLYMNCFKKQNINFVEILFTDYFVLNPKYAEAFSPMFEFREEIARYDIKAALNCMVGMAYEKQKALCHPYPTLKEKIEKYGFDGKQLSHVVRICEFMVKYIDGKLYSDCLKTDYPFFLKEIKRNRLFTLKDAVKFMDEYVNFMSSTKNKYLNSHIIEKNEKVESIMNKVIVDCMKQNLASL